MLAPGSTPCVMCLKPATKQCSGCHAFWYCGIDCQRKHWRTHKNECQKANELCAQKTPKEIIAEIDEKEREFLLVSELVKRNRSATNSKMVWVARSGECLKEDMEDARQLPGIRERLEACDRNPSGQAPTLVKTLFSATEGVSAAKSKSYFEQIEPYKEKLRELAKQDEEQGTTTHLRFGTQPPSMASAPEAAADASLQEEGLALGVERLTVGDQVRLKATGCIGTIVEDNGHAYKLCGTWHHQDEVTDCKEG